MPDFPITGNMTIDTAAAAIIGGYGIWFYFGRSHPFGWVCMGLGAFWGYMLYFR